MTQNVARAAVQAREAGTVSVLIALPDPIARRTVAALVEEASGLRCVDAVANGAEIVSAVEGDAGEPMLVLMDEVMPDIDALDVIRRVGTSRPGVRVVVLADDAEEGVSDGRGLAAVRAGAVGYLGKDVSHEVLVRVLRKVADGEAAVPRTLTGRLLERLRWSSDGAWSPGATGALSPHLKSRIAIAFLGLISGTVGLVVALALPHSPEAATVAGGVHLTTEYYVTLLIGSIEAIVFGVILGSLTLLRPYSRYMPALRVIVLVLSILVALGAVLGLLDYYTR